MHLQKMAGLHDGAWTRRRSAPPSRTRTIDFAGLAPRAGVWARARSADPAALGPALARAVARVKRGEPALVDVVSQAADMKRIFIISLFTASSAFAQDQTPSGSVEAGYKAFMKYQCYTCHGTSGRAATAAPAPSSRPIRFPGRASSTRCVRPPGHAGLPQAARVGPELADIYAYVRSIKLRPT